MLEERPRLAALEIEEELLAELRKLPTLHDTQSVTIRPYSGPKSWTWELDKSNRKWGLRKSGLSTWRPSSLGCSNNMTSISALRPQPEKDEAARPTKPAGGSQCGASWCT